MLQLTATDQIRCHSDGHADKTERGRRGGVVPERSPVLAVTNHYVAQTLNEAQRGMRVPLCSVWRRYPICGRHCAILHKDIKTFKRRGNEFGAVFPSTRGSDGSVFHATVFDLWPCHLGWREKEQPLRSWLWSPVSPSSEPHSASCPPPPALGWRTSEEKQNMKLNLNVGNHQRVSLTRCQLCST